VTPEGKIQSQIIGYINEIGVSAKVTAIARTGWPDVVGVVDGTTFFIEVKKEGGTTKRKQNFVHKLIRAHGGIVLVVTTLQEVKDFIERGQK